MKEHKHIYRILLLSAALASCQQMEDDLKDPFDPEVFMATMESCEPDTRTTLTDLSDGRQYAKWTDADSIAVFQGGEKSSKYILSDSSKGTFRPEELLPLQSDFPANIAVYPYTASVKVKVKKTNIDNYTLSNVIFPEVQQYVENSFAEESFVMVAVTSKLDDRVLQFRNICGGLRLQLKGSGDVQVTSIALEGNNDEVIAGKGEVSYVKKSDGTVISKFEAIKSEAGKTITLACPEVQLNDTSATEFIISLPPVKFSNGFTVTVNAKVGDKEDSTYIRSSDKRHQITRSRILTMPEIVFGDDSSHPETPQEGDYIDEYGINHGQGVKIGETVWAPVNCGYHATDFKYGKLYQWGRKYGQGYSESYDESVPELVEGPVMPSVAQSEENKDKFYYVSSSSDWCSSQDNKSWNSGSESAPVKTEYDPCPEGWRVPTYAELDELSNNYSSMTTADNGQIGRWFSGPNSYTASVPQVFFPAAGYRYGDGSALPRGSRGGYWSSRPSGAYACGLYFDGSSVDMGDNSRATGYSVRCVQATDEVAEL